MTNQDHAFRLLGLAWGDAAAAVIRQEARSLAALQRADGGWSQLPAMVSDAYATGEAVFALGSAGRMTVGNPVFQKGVDYLLRTQAIDGSWHVRSRAIWLQPYLDSGFPLREGSVHLYRRNCLGHAGVESCSGNCETIATLMSFAFAAPLSSDRERRNVARRAGA